MRNLELITKVYPGRVISECRLCGNVCVCSVYTITPSDWTFYCHHCKGQYQLKVTLEVKDEQKKAIM